MNKSCSLVLQARTGSNRLPRKTVLPFYQDLSILDIQLKRLLQVVSASNIIIATTNKNDDNAIVDIAKHHGVFYFRGDEQNVLSRFTETAKEFRLDSLIRICTDNVFLDLDDLLHLWKMPKHDFEYVSFSINHKPCIQTHYGLWAEWVAVDTLLKVMQKTTDTIYTEHVTNYIYAHPNQFKIKFVPKEIHNDNDIRLTTDTEEDFKLHQGIFSDLFDKHGFNFTTKHIFDYLNEHQELKIKMKQQIIQNEK